MFTTISWSNYWILIASLFVVYYTAVLLLYYRKHFLKLLPHVQGGVRHPSVSKPTSAGGIATNDPDNAQTETPENELFVMQSLEDEIQSFFESIDAAPITKEILIVSIKKIIGRYSSIKAISNRAAISKRIIFLAKQHSSLNLSTEEAGTVWI